MKKTFIAGIILLSACGSVKRSPSQDAILRSMNTVESLRVDASIQANSKQEYSLVARYNPGKCDCPQFEIFAYGEWQRAPFSGEKSALLASRNFANAGTDTMKRVNIRGRFSGEKEAAPNGVIYETFQLSKFEY